MTENIRICSGVVILQDILDKSGIYEDGVVLIKTRNFRDSVTGDYVWTIPGGRIERRDIGESEELRAAACVKREAWEEVRLTLEDLHYLGKETKTGRQMQYKNPETQFILYDFVARGKGAFNALEILFANDEVVYAGLHKRSELEQLSPIDPKLRSLIIHAYDYYAKTYKK